jgi:hypothetical protein
MMGLSGNGAEVCILLDENNGHLEAGRFSPFQVLKEVIVK